MSFNATKNIFLAYCSEDLAVASRLRGALQSLMGDHVWMRDFDLDGGSLVVEELTDAAAEAKWFLILLSKASIDCQWMKTEASLATFRALKDLDARIVVLNLDNIRMSQTLKFAVEREVNFDLFKSRDLDEEFFKIADYIQQHSAAPETSDVYVNRGKRRTNSH